MNDQELQAFSKDEIRDIIKESIMNGLKIYLSTTFSGMLNIEVRYDDVLIDSDSVNIRLL